jgi:HNH endonuclease.
MKSDVEKWIGIRLFIDKHAPTPKERYRNKSESRSHARDIFFDIYDGDAIRCADCREDKRLEVHHLNEDPFDNEWTNLVGLCRECHQGRHYGSSE